MNDKLLQIPSDQGLVGVHVVVTVDRVVLRTAVPVKQLTMTPDVARQLAALLQEQP